MQSIAGRSQDEFISDILLTVAIHGRVSIDWPEKTYINSVGKLEVV